MKKQKKTRKISSREGITLIALIITIIILIIITGISITLTFGENGIIKKAQYAKEQSESGRINEEEQLNITTQFIEDYNKQNINREKSKLELLKDTGKYVEEKTIVEDINRNEVVIPSGFKISEDSGITVDEGIVIEDKDIVQGIGNNKGNQYVWIPVGEITKSDLSKVNIIHGRYEFSEDGTPILKQNSIDYTNEIEIIGNGGAEHKELAISRIGIEGYKEDSTNTTALNLAEYIKSVENNGGYYIARYEASYGIDEKPNSKISNLFSISEKPTQEGTLWNFISQVKAAKVSRNIYTDTNIVTDLINSYAWDTAIVFIQNCSEIKNYSKIHTPLVEPQNTGTTNDEICKINDMSSNFVERTTEYSTEVSYGLYYRTNVRGGSYEWIKPTDFRSAASSNQADRASTFRTILYIV